VELDIHNHRLEQAVLFEGVINLRPASQSFVDDAQDRGDMVEIGSIAAMLEEQGETVVRPHPRVVEVDMDHGFPWFLPLDLGPRNRHREGTATGRGRHIGAGPAIIFKKQILVAIQSQQGISLHALVSLAEDDREMPLRFLELCREDRHLIDAVAKRRAGADRDLQVGVVDIVDKDAVHRGRLSQIGFRPRAFLIAILRSAW
jgi:hypothetical protein